MPRIKRQRQIMKTEAILLNESENKAAEKFAWAHYKKHRKTAEVIVHAKQTGLGYAVTVKCQHCKKELDITDSSNW